MFAASLHTIVCSICSTSISPSYAIVLPELQWHAQAAQFDASVWGIRVNIGVENDINPHVYPRIPIRLLFTYTMQVYFAPFAYSPVCLIIIVLTRILCSRFKKILLQFFVHSLVGLVWFVCQLQAINGQQEKRQRQFDKLIDEWKRKVTDLQNELDIVQKESRSNAAEAYKFKGQLEETQEVIDTLRRENKNLSGQNIHCFSPPHR